MFMELCGPVCQDSIAGQTRSTLWAGARGRRWEGRASRHDVLRFELSRKFPGRPASSPNGTKPGVHGSPARTARRAISLAGKRNHHSSPSRGYSTRRMDGFIPANALQ